MNPADMIATLERFIPLRYLQESTQEMLATVGQVAPPNIGDPRMASRGCNLLIDWLMSLLGRGNTSSGGTSGDNPRPDNNNSPSGGSSGNSSGGRGGSSSQNPTPMPNRKENLVDCALAKLVSHIQVDSMIPQIGTVNGIKSVNIGMPVAKHGRTTGLRKSTVTLLNATVDVGYNTPRGERTARFTAQILTGGMSDGGDSGSLVVDPTDNMAVGLLFGGSPQASLVTPIQAVLSALNVSLI